MASSTDNIAQNLERYSIHQWGEEYFGIDANGHLCVNMAAAQSASAYAQPIPLLDIINNAKAEGLALPLLLRFDHILEDRIHKIHAAFQSARNEYDYQNDYQLIYPIKVNQQAAVVNQLVSAGGDRLGLEAGSKTELLQVLAIANDYSTIICNGYKDDEYLSLALTAQSLGYKVYIVVEKLKELERLIQLAEKLDIKPKIGIRIRLTSITEGNWQNTGGEKSKFGLSVSQIVKALDLIRSRGFVSSLNLLHVHLGSQIPNIRTIQKGVREAVRYYLALAKDGFDIQVLDLGGGLGVDYDGTRSRNACSMNYSLEQYASAIVRTVSEMCAQQDISVPILMSESGRALTAHHAVLIADVVEKEIVQNPQIEILDNNAPLVLKDLYSVLNTINSRNARENYQETLHWMDQCHHQFLHGLLSIEERALAERLYQAIIHKIRMHLKPEIRAQATLLEELNEKLAEKWFCNFSVFQSLPDVWAIGQHFPIVPLQSLNQAPNHYALIKDLTCDSDGRIDFYVQEDGVESVLKVHEFNQNEEYLLGFFMVGAYQEILGDMHNLFGDTDSASVILQGDHFILRNKKTGDVGRNLLTYVGYDPDELRNGFIKKIEQAGISNELAKRLTKIFDDGLNTTTYLKPAT